MYLPNRATTSELSSNFNTLKFILRFKAWANKTEDITVRFRDKIIRAGPFFVLFPQNQV